MPCDPLLVLGAAQRLGACIAEHLLQRGYALHLLVAGEEAAAPWREQGAKVFLGTLQDPNAIAAAASGCRAVVHAEALTAHAMAQDLYAVHVAGTENVLQAVRHAGCPRLIHLSTADVSLAACDRVHWQESRYAPGRPRHAYVQTRRLAEDLVVGGADAALQTVSLRPALLWSDDEALDVAPLLPKNPGQSLRLVGSGDKLLSTTQREILLSAVQACLEARSMPSGAYFIVDDAMHTAKEFFGAWSQRRGLPPPQPSLPWPLAYALSALHRLMPNERSQSAARSPLDVLRLAHATHFDASRFDRELARHAEANPATRWTPLPLHPSRPGGVHGPTLAGQQD